MNQRHIRGYHHLEHSVTSIYDFSAKAIDGAEMPLSQYEGKAILW